MPQSIHQLYCTHCTYGTSALHRHTGNVQHQPFEYSTRAGSVAQSLAHQTFQRFEKQYFRGLPLPGDASLELRKSEAADVPWKRLVYSPSVDGMTLLAHVCYRPYDTAGRMGSYFAHVLLQEQSHTASRWNALDCLKLWDSRFWVRAEDPAWNQHPHELERSFDLEMLDSLQDLSSGGSICDQALEEFLSESRRPGTLDSPLQLGRWKEIPLSRRRALVESVLHAVLELDVERHERLILAVEPSIAALLFYAVFRMLPRSGIAERLSFSTFESHLDRPSTTLVAYDFSEPASTDLMPETYRSKGFVINTYRPERPLLEFRSPNSRYARQMVETLISQDGPAALDRLLAQFTAAGAKSSEELIALAALRERIVSFIRAEAPWNEIVCESDCQRHFAALLLSDYINQLPAENVQTLAAVPTFLNILDLTSSLTNNPEATQAVRRMVSVMPNRKGLYAAFFSLPHLSTRIKTLWLRSYLKARKGVFPAGCPAIWETRHNPSEILVELLNVSTSEEIESWTIPEEFQFCFATGLCMSKELTPEKKAILAAAIDRLGWDDLCRLLKSFRDRPTRLIEALGSNVPRLVSRLKAMQRKLRTVTGSAVVSWADGVSSFAPHLLELRDTASRWKEVRSAVATCANFNSSDKKGFEQAVSAVLISLASAFSSSDAVLCPLDIPRTSIEAVMRSCWEGLPPTNLPAAILSLADMQLRSVDDLGLCRFLASSVGKEWIRTYPPENETLCKQLRRILDELPNGFSSLSERLQGLEAGKRYLGAEVVRLQQWQMLERTLLKIKSLRSRFRSISDMQGHDVVQAAIELGPHVVTCLRDRMRFDKKTDQLEDFGILENLSRGVLGDCTLTESRFFPTFICKAFRDSS